MDTTIIRPENKRATFSSKKKTGLMYYCDVAPLITCIIPGRCGQMWSVLLITKPTCNVAL